MEGSIALPPTHWTKFTKLFLLYFKIHNTNFFSVTYEWTQKARVFVLGMLFRSSLMLGSYEEAYQSEVHPRLSSWLYLLTLEVGKACQEQTL
jgi:hypothetical protein